MEKKLSQSQKMMIFILSMSLYGLATLLSELIPKVQVGLVEFSVEYFFFIPLTLAMIFPPLPVALGAATGELVFSEIMLGQFGGLGEVEKFITVTIGICLAGVLVHKVKERRQIIFGAVAGVTTQLALGMIVDILKVKLAVEDFEAVAGLPESVFFTEGFSFLNDLIFSGTLFCVLPTIYLAPRLYGKIEPLLGIRPRKPEEKIGIGFSFKFILLAIVGFAIAVSSECLAESGMGLIDWEAAWSESAPSIITAIVLAIIILGVMIRHMQKRKVLLEEMEDA